MRVLIFDDLKAKGIQLSKVTLWRMEKRGAFPKRVRIGAAAYGWIEKEIDDWLKQKIAERDAA